MSKGSNVYFKLYMGDYLADTRHLTTVEHGAFLLMLMHYYRTQKPLPDDDAELQSISGLRGNVWKQKKARLAKFFDIHDGQWHQKRADEEIAKAKEIYSKRVRAAKPSNTVSEIRQTSFDSDAKNSQVIDLKGNTNSICPSDASQSESKSDSYIKNIAKEEYNTKRQNKSEILDKALKAYNSIAVQHGGVICKVLNPIKQSKLLKRVEDAKGIDMFETILMEAVRQSQFLQGKLPPTEKHPKPFRLSIDFICQEDSFNKILNGNYNDQPQAFNCTELRPTNKNYSGNEPPSAIKGIVNYLARKEAGIRSW